MYVIQMQTNPITEDFIHRQEGSMSVSCCLCIRDTQKAGLHVIRFLLGKQYMFHDELITDYDKVTLIFNKLLIDVLLSFFIT